MTWSYWRSDHSLAHPWSLVATGYWWRYPNPQSSHVFSVDTLEMEVRGEQLYTKRLLLKTNSLPSWGKHFFKDLTVVVVEESLVDRDTHRLVWYTRNIGLNRFMSTVEKATFTPASSSSTSVTKECWINSSIFGFRSAIKKFGVDRYKKNCLPATQGFDWVIKCHLDQSKPFNESGLVPLVKIFSSDKPKETKLVNMGLSKPSAVEC